jgi:hypothetical protein
VSNTEEVKKTYLAFVSSELTAHAATIIGVSVLFFTCANLFTQNSILPPIQFPLTVTISKATFDYIIAWLIFWLLAAVGFYSFMRLIHYGALAHQIIVNPEQTEHLHLLRSSCERALANKGIVSWFACGIAWRSRGMYLSIIIGLIVSIIVITVLFVK